MKLSTSFIPRALKNVEGFAETRRTTGGCTKAKHLVGSGICIKSKIGYERRFKPHKILLDSECSVESFLYVDLQNKGDRDRITPFCSSHFLGSDGMIFDTENIKDPDRKISGKALSPSEVWQSH